MTTAAPTTTRVLVEWKTTVIEHYRAYFDVNDLAEELGVEPEDIQRWAADGSLEDEIGELLDDNNDMLSDREEGAYSSYDEVTDRAFKSATAVS